jgi:hypothetical protein
VVSGMIGVTIFGLLFTPVFYVMVRWIEDRFARRKTTPPAAEHPAEQRN